MVVFGQRACIRAKVVVFGQKWFNAQSGCIRVKIVVFGKSCCIRAKVVLLWKSG